MKTLYADNSIITQSKKFTFLSGDVVAGATSAIGVISTLEFTSLTTSSGQIIVVGEIGQPKTEVIKTSATTAPGGTSITLNTALRFDHPQDTKVYLVDWDRFEVQWASTVTGSKSTLMAYPQAVQPELLESIFKDTTQSSGYYFVRFNETIGSTNSDWSDPVPYSGYTDASVHEIKLRALELAGDKIDNEIVTNEFLNRCLWEARREYHSSPGKRPFRRSYNVDIGNVTTGMYRIDLPPYVEKPYSAENVYGVRVGTQQNMIYYDKKEWDFDFLNKPHTILTTAYTVGDQDLYVNNVRDFTPSGSVTVEQDSIAYSAIGITGGTMRISTAGSKNHAVSLDVWQNATYGLPTKFTVFADVGGSAYIYFNRILDTSYVNQNVYADYYRTILEFDSDADVLDEPDPDIYVPYLAARIKKKRNPALELTKDSDYQLWLLKKQGALATEYAGTEIRFVPDVFPL